MATIPFIAYEISGVKGPTYPSGAANKKYVDLISGSLNSKISEAAAGGTLASAFQTLTASTGVTPFTSTVKVSSSTSQTLSVLGYATISGNAQKAKASAQTALLDADFGTNGIMTRTGAGVYSYVTDNSAQWNNALSSGVKYTSAYKSANTGVFAISTRNLTAGNGLTGGGTLAADRTVDVGEGTGIQVAADAVSVRGYTTISGNARTSYDWFVASAQKLSAADLNQNKAYASAQALKAHAFKAKISAQYLAVNYGWATTTDGVATIAHGLSSLPKSHWVVPSGVISFGIVTKIDATNITASITAAGSRILQWWASV